VAIPDDICIRNFDVSTVTDLIIIIIIVLI